MIDHHVYLNRCVELAWLANKRTKSNPMVGAVLVYNDRIIGEGYHEYYGGPHAEVNAIQSVKEVDIYLIHEATLYISLEPCNTFGKTPPCTNLIVKNKIKKVVIGALDPNPLMNGKSVDWLKKNSLCKIQVENHEGCRQLIKKFIKNLSHQSYIILKWAQSSDNWIGREGSQMKISDRTTDIMMHKHRGEVDGILIGKNTALVDNPTLDTRHYLGENPVRILIDDRLEVPLTHLLYREEGRVIVFNQVRNTTLKNIYYCTYDKQDPKSILRILYEQNIFSCLVEGGAKILTYFIKNNLWDEAIIIKSKLPINNIEDLPNIAAPLLKGNLIKKICLENDTVEYIKPME